MFFRMKIRHLLASAMKAALDSSLEINKLENVTNKMGQKGSIQIKLVYSEKILLNP